MSPGRRRPGWCWPSWHRPAPQGRALRRSVLLLAMAMLVCGMALGGGFLWFAAQARRVPPLPDRADGIVVLTGGAGRVELAMRLMAEGRGRLLLVSGTGRGDFADIVARARVDEALAARVSPAQVTLGRGARSTRGNARETAEWAAAHGMHSLIVVTSGYHMGRAMLELHRTLPPDVVLHPAPLVPHLPDGHDRVPLRLLAAEYAKWLGAAVGLSALASREQEGAWPSFGGEGAPAREGG